MIRRFRCRRLRFGILVLGRLVCWWDDGGGGGVVDGNGALRRFVRDFSVSVWWDWIWYARSRPRR